MTAEELLIPRYKVVSEWPDMLERFSIGYVFEHPYGRQYLTENSKCDPADFPGLFKKLQWLEEREEKDMPEYLKFETGTDIEFVLKVEKYKLHEGGGFWAFEYLWQNEPDIKRMSLQGWTPATKGEYDAYCQTKSPIEG